MKKALLAAAILSCASVVHAGAPFYGELMPSQFMSLSTTTVIFTGDIDRFSMQVNVSTATRPERVSFTDGAKATANISVPFANISALIARVAASSITIVSNSAISAGAVVTINGQTFIEGRDWTKAGVSSNTAISLKSAIDANPGINASVGNVGSSAIVVFASAAVVGTYANGWAVSSNSSGIYAQTPFQNGQDNAQLCIAGTCLVQGTAWTAVVGSSLTTAMNIHNAIRDNATLAAIVVSTPSIGVVFSTAIAVGTSGNYSLTTSSYTALTPSSFAYGGGTDSSVDLTANTIYVPNHGLPVGYQVLLATATPVTGLTANTTYYVIPTTPNLFKLALTSTGAAAGLAIDFTAQTGGGTWSLTPVPYSATGASSKFQASNDGYQWTDIANTTQALTGTGAGVFTYDFGAYNYRFVRWNFTGPTSGAILTNVVTNGKRVGPD